MEEYSIYCDETCHLEHDHESVMALGAVWCPTSKRQEIYKRIHDIKKKYGISHAEMKWTRLSPNKLSAYLELIDYFFDDDDLHFRAIVIPEKDKLNHAAFGQTHNQWYYKMYFELLKNIISNGFKYNTFLDIKDTIGGEKVEKLHEVLSNQMYDFNHDIIEKIQLIRSDEVEIMQLVDILTGAVMAENRPKTISDAKRSVINRIKERSNFSLRRSTLPSERKFNVFVWSGREQ